MNLPDDVTQDDIDRAACDGEPIPEVEEAECRYCGGPIAVIDGSEVEVCACWPLRGIPS